MIDIYDLLKQYGTYGKVAIWLKGSKTYGDGSYNYKQKCKSCGK